MRSTKSSGSGPAKRQMTASANMPLRCSKRLAEQQNPKKRPHVEAELTKVFHGHKACSDNGAYRILPHLALQELKDQILNNVKTYTEWLQHPSCAPLEALQALYDSDLRFAGILDESTDRHGRLQYLISWTHAASDRSMLTLSSRQTSWLTCSRQHMPALYRSQQRSG